MTGIESHDGERACCAPSTHAAQSDVEFAPVVRPRERSTRGQTLITAGTFQMGDAFGEGYPGDGEMPVHEVGLSPYYMDLTTVTNAQFATFVKATGYVTDAERFGSSAVFHLLYEGDASAVLGRVLTAPWWLDVREASWRMPSGRGSTIAHLQNHPVVHVSWNDAIAYCRWAGKRLPSEAEWEFAARGGRSGQRFAWGNELTPRGRWMCNIWQGEFPDSNTKEDGFLGTAPVRSYSPNGFGLWNTAGNVWEWCGDWFDIGYYGVSPRLDPTGPATGEQRVMRGGSFLCHDSYCNRYRVAARSSNSPDSSSSNLGFRCANDGVG